MSSLAPKFLSGPRIAIKVGNATIAYAVGLNLSISATVVPVTTFGRFDAASLEPTAYGLVRGSMTVVKLKSNDSSADILPPSGTVGNSSGLAAHLNPYTVLLSETFDLAVEVANVSRNSKVNSISSYERLKVHDCRLTAMNGAVVVAQLLNETVNFEGLLITDQVSIKESIDTPAGT